MARGRAVGDDGPRRSTRGGAKGAGTWTGAPQATAGPEGTGACGQRGVAYDDDKTVFVGDGPLGGVGVVLVEVDGARAVLRTSTIRRVATVGTEHGGEGRLAAFRASARTQVLAAGRARTSSRMLWITASTGLPLRASHVCD